MSLEEKLIAFFKANLNGVGVFVGVIPESEPVPAIAIYNVAYNSGRVLSGDKTGRSANFRITLVDTVERLQSTIDAIELLDNTVNSDFQKLFIDLSLKEPKAPTEPHQRAFFDLKVY